MFLNNRFPRGVSPGSLPTRPQGGRDALRRWSLLKRRSFEEMPPQLARPTLGPGAILSNKRDRQSVT